MRWSIIPCICFVGRPADLVIDIVFKAMAGPAFPRVHMMPTAASGRRTLEVLCQVCYAWREALLSCPLLWRSHVYEGTTKATLCTHAQREGLAMSIQRSQHLLMTAKVTLQDALATPSLKQCVHLSELDLSPSRLWEYPPRTQVFPEKDTQEDAEKLEEFKTLVEALPSLRKLWLPEFLLWRKDWAAVQVDVRSRSPQTCDACNASVCEGVEAECSDCKFV